jgi:hypothetical protein
MRSAKFAESLDIHYPPSTIPNSRNGRITGYSEVELRTTTFSLHGNAFIRLTSAQQTAILAAIANPQNPNPKDQTGVDFIQLIKRLTIFGYYTSEMGLEQELKYRGDTYNVSFPGACTHPEHQT